MSNGKLFRYNGDISSTIAEGLNSWNEFNDLAKSCAKNLVFICFKRIFTFILFISHFVWCDTFQNNLIYVMVQDYRCVCKMSLAILKQKQLDVRGTPSQCIRSTISDLLKLRWFETRNQNDITRFLCTLIWNLQSFASENVYSYAVMKTVLVISKWLAWLDVVDEVLRIFDNLCYDKVIRIDHRNHS